MEVIRREIEEIIKVLGEDWYGGLSRLRLSSSICNIIVLSIILKLVNYKNDISAESISTAYTY